MQRERKNRFAFVPFFIMFFASLLTTEENNNNNNLFTCTHLCIIVWIWNPKKPTKWIKPRRKLFKWWSWSWNVVLCTRQEDFRMEGSSGATAEHNGDVDEDDVQTRIFIILYFFLVPRNTLTENTTSWVHHTQSEIIIMWMDDAYFFLQHLFLSSLPLQSSDTYHHHYYPKKSSLSSSV